MLYYRLFFIAIISFCFPVYAYFQPISPQECRSKRLVVPAVTYTFSGGRFGDNLLAYFHAKWISYKYGLPLLYKPFPYSDRLHMHVEEQRYYDVLVRASFPTVTIHNIVELNKVVKTPSLLIMPYFPESEWESIESQKVGRPWTFIPVDWKDPEFRNQLQQMVKPREPIKKIHIPDGVISVACHIRRGSGDDSANTVRHAALKFPQDSFYISEIRWLLDEFHGKKLYVYLFTDAPEPLKIKKSYEAIFKDCPIIFDCRLEPNTRAHIDNVVEDFFSLTQFDCAIHGESNFSLCAAKLSSYIRESQPLAFHWEGNDLVIDKVLRQIGSEKRIFSKNKMIFLKERNP